VPFKAAPEILGEMMAGRIDYFLAPIAVALPFVRDGKLAALAVNTPARLPTIPDVPTLSEAGFVNAEYSFWIAVFVPVKTSGVIVEKLARETRKALAEPKLRFLRQKADWRRCRACAHCRFESAIGGAPQ
jgi:tripartite-type tricarboxylate transporter receptor subunit TctC